MKDHILFRLGLDALQTGGYNITDAMEFMTCMYHIYYVEQQVNAKPLHKIIDEMGSIDIIEYIDILLYKIHTTTSDMRKIISLRKIQPIDNIHVQNALHYLSQIKNWSADDLINILIQNSEYTKTILIKEQYK